jgi:hypothetical protein
MLTALGWAAAGFGLAFLLDSVRLWMLPEADRREVVAWVTLGCLTSSFGCAFVAVWAWTRF